MPYRPRLDSSRHSIMLPWISELSTKVWRLVVLFAERRPTLVRVSDQPSYTDLAHYQGCYLYTYLLVSPSCVNCAVIHG